MGRDTRGTTERHGESSYGTDRESLSSLRSEAAERLQGRGPESVCRASLRLALLQLWVRRVPPSGDTVRQVEQPVWRQGSLRLRLRRWATLGSLQRVPRLLPRH